MNRYDPIKAIELAQKAVDRDPAFAEAYEFMAFAYWSGGTDLKSDEAQKGTHDAAAKALELDPDLHFAQALFRESMEGEQVNGEWVFETLERGLCEEPNHIGMMNVLEWDLLAAGYFKEALPVTERLVELEPLAPSAHGGLASARIANGLRSEALESLQTALQLQPDTSLSLAVFYLRDGKSEARCRLVQYAG